MNITELLTDDAILVELGERIKHRRLDLQLTQADLAEQAGVSKRTVERIEAGASAQLSSVIRIFRVLDLLSGLDRMLPEVVPSPMDLLKRKGNVRQRVSTRRPSNPSPEPWSWEDD